MESDDECTRNDIGNDAETELMALDGQFETPPRPIRHQGCSHMLKSFGVDGSENLIVSSLNLNLRSKNIKVNFFILI